MCSNSIRKCSNSIRKCSSSTVHSIHKCSRKYLNSIRKSPAPGRSGMLSGKFRHEKKPGGLRMPRRLPYASNIFFYNTWAPPGLCKRPHVKIFSEFRDQFTYFWIFFEKLGQIFDRNPKIKFVKYFSKKNWIFEKIFWDFFQLKCHLKSIFQKSILNDISIGKNLKICFSEFFFFRKFSKSFFSTKNYVFSMIFF